MGVTKGGVGFWGAFMGLGSVGVEEEGVIVIVMVTVMEGKC